MRLQDNIDFTTLQWVYPELEKTLLEARESLEAYVDNPARDDALRTCAAALHQVQGTLRMVELQGPASVAGAMENLVTALLEDRIEQREDAYATLMRGLMQLPDYLERLAGGHRDVPVVLLPLLNDLRAQLGEEALPESALFHPNLDAFLPAQAPAAMSEAQAADRHGDLNELRLQFQQYLLAWFRAQTQLKPLVGMRKSLMAVAARCFHVHGRRLWWITAGVLEGLEQGMLGAQAAELRQLIGKVDRNLRLLIERGEDSLRGGEADELCNRLLYAVAQARQSSPHMELLRRTYSLDALLPDAEELEHARGSMAGHNRALLDSVAKALKEDLLRVKESLDLFQRQPDADPAALAPQCEVLGRLGDTLGMLALSVPRRVVEEQRRVLDEVVNKMRPADENTLLDVAGALLYVETSLDDHIENLGASEGLDEAEDGGMPSLPRSEAHGVLGAVIQEAILNTGKVKEAIVAFVESGWEHAGLAEAPALMSEVAGAARMLDAARPAELAEGIGRFIHNELLVDRRVPSSTQMDCLADALAALEYYLEAAREHRGGLAHIIDVAEHSLGKLGYWPLPALRALPEVAEAETVRHDEPLSEPVSLYTGSDATHLFVAPEAPHEEPAHDVEGLRFAQTEPTAPPHAEDEGDWVEIEEEIEEQVPASDALAGAFHFDAGAEGIDDDIREIFLEEMQEEIANLTSGQAAWLAEPTRLDALTPVRRSFHTLKGSGRLVGIPALGEFAWRVEDMLNRVLDRTIEPHAGVQALVGHAIAALPQLLASLKGESVPTAPIEAIMQTASKLAAGDAAARVEDCAPAAMETVRRIVRRRVPRVDAAAVPVAAVTDAHSVPAAAPEEAPIVLALSPLPSVDPVLLEILRSEVAQYVQTIRTAIQRSSGALPVSEDLLHAVHTLHGAIAMVDIPLLTQLLSPMEGLLKRLRHVDQPLSADGVSLLSRTADVVDHTMAQFDVAAPQLPNVDLLIKQITELRDHYPESRVGHAAVEPLAEPLETEANTLDELEGEKPAFKAPTELPETAHHDDLTRELMAALGAFDPGALEAVTDSSAHEHAEAERVEAERVEAERAEAERVEAERVEAERAEAERVEAERAEAERAEAERAEAERAEAERARQEQAEQARLAQERAAREAAELQMRAAAERAAAEQRAAEAAAAEAASEALDRATEAARHEPVAAPAHAVAAPVDTGEALTLDPDLIEIFVEEAREILDHADDTLAQWHADPAATAHRLELQRDLHTLKGGARIAGLASIGDLTHSIETRLEHPLSDPTQTSSLIGLLEASFDHLHGMVELVAQNRAPAYPQAMIDQLLGQESAVPLAEPASEPVAAAEEAPVAAPVLAAQAPVAEAPAATAAPLRPLPDLLPEEGHAAAEAHAATQEQIRVRAELLDDLVNHAGEVAIYRARLEQQVSGYRFNLVELDQTVQRLRGQLRMLEIETEAQIIARFQREHREAGVMAAAFDPLELDRFSQLQQYSRALAESVSDLVSIQGTLDELTRQAENLLVQQSRVSTELQEGLLRTRMLPFDTMVPNLRRTLRQAAQDENKSAQLVVDGAHGEMDRNLLDRIKAPFEHMLRNAVAHGIETPEARRQAGKPAEGTVRIAVAREANEVVVQVADDGRGLDREAIRARGIERGLLRADARVSDEQILGLITQTGFSTASAVTQLAGRGVGMDVVANEIKQLGGALAIESTQGQGTTFTLRLPFTLAVTQAILVRVGESTFAIPMTSVQGVARTSPEELAAKLAEHAPSFDYKGESYDIHDLAELLGLPPGVVPEGELPPLLLSRAGDQRAAIRIDAVLGSREVVVKSVGPQVSSVPGVLGATIMGDGSVMMILDLAPLVRHGVTRREERVAAGLSAAPVLVHEEVRTRPLVMVVDDSITMRKVTGRVLERHEYEVGTAKDGVDALEKLVERVPDLMLLDIEMPRMDGYELATHMKADPRLRNVPIIMITSRSGEKHRQRAFDIGVDRYLGKPYQENELLAQIEEVLEQRALIAAGMEPQHD